MTSNKPGKKGDLLDENDVVIRLGMKEQSSYDKVPASVFNMTEIEKKSNWKRTSVWENSLTTDRDAINMARNPERRLIVKIKVANIREIEEYEIDVKWDPWYGVCYDNNENRIENAPQGCEGHCGLEGLFHKDAKIRRSIRRRMAEEATKYGVFYILEEF